MNHLLNQVINADCFDVFPTIPDRSIDMIFCDLPYGTTKSHWDAILPFDSLWFHYERIIKDNGAIVLFAKAPFDKVLATSNMRLFRYEWIWEKNKATGHLNAGIMPMQAHENLLVFYKSPPVYNPQMTSGHKPKNAAVFKHTSSVYGSGRDTAAIAGTTERQPRSVLYFPVVNNDDPERIHPNQKPVDLCEYMIRTYTNVGATVLDNCAGSCSVPVAAIKSRRNYIAIEKDREIYKKAMNRLNCVQTVLNF
ncbi:methyltransferase [Paenibacillus dendritiformis]|uniref:DNA-methyltransferase n=1 Tax=Paenibacillus TaxID=44249 RepID=UPI001B0B14C5|nr:site-specific DNA-methyltransferase [Paenibacillus dendritiformis]GIO82893.1 methyltransferase [Paenibacillus dendritiformis]